MKKLIYSISIFIPVIAFGAANDSLDKIIQLVTNASGILKLLIPMAFAVAVIYFFWGVAKYIGKAGDPKAQEEGKNIMIGGVIGIAVMASVYGLVGYLQDTLGITNPNTTITIPGVKGL
jgi:hypothetical protein